MKNYPEKIESLQFQLADLNTTIERERERIDVLEADLTLEIHTERDENGKPLYTNDATRKAVFVKSCASHPDIVMLAAGLQKLESDRLKILATAERLRLEYKLFLLDREAEIKR